MPAQLFIGTSSWAEKALVDSGRFYPEEAKDTPARLEYYSKRFNFAAGSKSSGSKLLHSFYT